MVLESSVKRFDPRDYSADELTRDGAPLHIRAIRPDDKRALEGFHGRLSSDTVYYRFAGAKKRLTKKELVYLTELDFHLQAAIVASLPEGDRHQIVAVARYASHANEPDHRAEIALTVEDEQQGRGIGTILLKHLMRIARAEGILEVDAFLLSDNEQMIRLLKKTGLVMRRSASAGLCHLVVSTKATPSSFPAV